METHGNDVTASVHTDSTTPLLQLSPNFPKRDVNPSFDGPQQGLAGFSEGQHMPPLPVAQQPIQYVTMVPEPVGPRQMVPPPGFQVVTLRTQSGNQAVLLPLEQPRNGNSSGTSFGSTVPSSVTSAPPLTFLPNNNGLRCAPGMPGQPLQNQMAPQMPFVQMPPQTFTPETQNAPMVPMPRVLPTNMMQGSVTSMPSTTVYPSSVLASPSASVGAPRPDAGQSLGNSATRRPPSHGSLSASSTSAPHDSLEASAGKLQVIARTRCGSSFIQASLRERPSAFNAVWDELKPQLASLLVDDNACYVAKMLLEMATENQLVDAVTELADNEQMWVNLSTRSLHSRRMVQFIMDRLGVRRTPFLIVAAQRNFHTLATSKEGCITLQRILDRCEPAVRENLFDQCRASLVQYSQDSFANFIVQYMIEHGDGARNLEAVRLRYSGHVHELACHQYASAVLEKAICWLGPPLHAVLLHELLNGVSDKQVCDVANDSRGNYVVQTLASEVEGEEAHLMASRIIPLASQLTYGPRLQSRLTRKPAPSAQVCGGESS